MRLISNKELLCVSGGAVQMPEPPEGQKGHYELQGETWVWIQEVTVTGQRLDTVDRFWASMEVIAKDCAVGGAGGGTIGGVAGTFVVPALGTATGAAAGSVIGCTVGVGAGLIGDIFDLRQTSTTQRP